MRVLLAIVGVMAATGAARGEETLRWGAKAGALPASITVRRDIKLDGTIAVFGKETPMRTFRSSEAEEREIDGGKLEIRMSRIVDEKGEASAGVAGKVFVVADDPKAVRAERKVAEAVTAHAKGHRRDVRMAKWLAAQTFVRDQPVKVPADELRKLSGSMAEWELFDGLMTLTWTGNQGATAQFRVELLLDVKGKDKDKPVSCHLKLAGTMAADVATAAIVETDLNGATVLKSIIPMNASVMVHDRRR